MRRTIPVLLYIALLAICAIAAADRTTWPLFVASMFVAAGALALIWKYATPSRMYILIVAVVLRLLVSWLPPTLSDDAYRYVWDGMVAAEGINPYLYRPSDAELESFSQEEIYQELNSADFYSVYPPVSQMVFAVSGVFYKYGWLYSYYIIKLLLMACEIGALFLLSRMVSSSLLLLYAWNPLVVVETAGQAHTEAVMLLFLVACLWFAKHKRPVLASVMLALAGWVKLYPFVFFPLLWRRFGWKGVLPGGFVALGMFLPYYHAHFFSNFSESLNLYVQYFEFNAGIYYSIKKIFMLWTGDDWSKSLGPWMRQAFLIGLPAIYLLDAWLKWSLTRSCLLITTLFIICSTTVHPWYFSGILLFLSFETSVRWHWHWLAIISLGTYLLYVDGPYWIFVHVAWWGWVLIAFVLYARKWDEWFQGVQRHRAAEKVQNIEALVDTDLEGSRILDLGAGEGYVGDAMHHTWQASVKLADVCDMNRTDLPHVTYDGHTLPFGDKTFDMTVLYFVLHHTEEPERVLDEAFRVTRNQVVVVESVYTTRWGRKVLTLLDIAANRLRSGGLMNAQEEHLGFKKAHDWRDIFREKGAKVVAEMARESPLHKQRFFVVTPPLL